MKRPAACIGFTFFLVLSFLYDKSLKAAAITSIVFAAGFCVSLIIPSVRKARIYTACCISALAACLVFSGYWQLSYAPSLSLDGKTCSISARVCEEEYRNNGHYYTIVKTDSVDGKDVSVKLRISSRNSLNASLYDRVRGEAVLFTLGNDDEGVIYHRCDGVFTGAYSADGFTITPCQKGERPFSYNFHLIRKSIKNAVFRIFPDECGEVIVALLTGDKTSMGDRLYASFRNAGVSHLICVSGLHLSVWALFLLRFAGENLKKKKIAAVFSIVFTLFFMGISGFTYSILRAGIMTIIVLAGIIFSKQSDSLTSLGIAVIGILAANPFAAGNVSFRLSVLSTLAVIVSSQYVLPPVREKLKNAPLFGKAVNSVIMSSVCVFFTLPVMVTTFGKVNFATVISNLLLVFPAGICMISGGITALISMIPHLGFLAFAPACVSGFSAKYLVKVTGFISRLSFLKLGVTADIFKVWFAFSLLLFAVSFLLLAKGKNRLPLSAGLVCLMFIATVLLDFINTSGNVRITVTDVGDGFAVAAGDRKNVILCGCSGSDYDSAYKITQVLDSYDYDSFSLLLFADDDEASSCINKVVKSNPPYSVSCTYPDNTLRILCPDSLFCSSSGRFNVSGSLTVESVCDDLSEYAVIDACGTTILAVIRPGSFVREAHRNADILIVRRSVPDCLAGCSFRSVIISGDADGYLIQQKLLSYNADAYCTCGNGNVIIDVSRSGGYTLLRQK